MQTIGALKKIEDLRTVWKNEERDFSAWLSKSDNLALLGNEIGIDLLLEEREASVGNGSIDILATEDGTGRKIIIENQLSDSNHDHLGKIISYAAGRDAKVIVWVVKRAKDEHQSAINWLNENTQEEIGFFLVEIELYQIGDSLPAPKFNILERPNEWTKAMRSDRDHSSTKQLQFNFWQTFRDYAMKTDFVHSFTLRKARPQHWYDIGIGMAEAHISLTVNTQKKRIAASIYIPNDKQLYARFEQNRDIIEGELGFKLDWQPIPEGKAARISLEKNVDLKLNSNWPEYFDWLLNMSKSFKAIFSKYKL